MYQSGRAWVRASMHLTVSWMMGGSTRTPCFQITTSFVSDCCTEAVRAALECERLGQKTQASLTPPESRQNRHAQTCICLLLMGPYVPI